LRKTLSAILKVISNDGKPVTTIVQEKNTISLVHNPSEPLQLRDKTLILALGFILVIICIHFPQARQAGCLQRCFTLVRRYWLGILKFCISLSTFPSGFVEE